MSFIDALIGVVAPYGCVVCGREGRLLCRICAGRLPPPVPRCYRCQQPSPGYRTCRPCQAEAAGRLERVWTAAPYEGAAKALLWQFKLAGARSAAALMAERLAPGLTVPAGPRPLVVPVPTATSRARRRGYDQARLLARELARQLRLPYRDCLVRTGQTQQHGLPRRERLVQLQGAFRVRRPRAVTGASVILVDDVVTTGATLEAAAAALLAAGARHISGAAFAQPP